MAYQFFGRAVLAAAALATLSGCAAYEAAKDRLGLGREGSGTRAAEAVVEKARETPTPTPPGANQPFPNLSTVPGARPETGSARDRLRVEQGLLADRENARHADGPVAAEESGNNYVPRTDVRPQVFTPGAAAAAGQPGAGAQPGVQGTSIVFANGSAALPSGSGALVVRAAEVQRAFGGTIVVVGHAAQNEGDPAARTALATQRARVIGEALRNLGVAPENIRIGAGTANASRVDLSIVGMRPPPRR
jgi:outer membrane protein OmpA-like peptidoglycan-associated protein